MNCEDYYNIVIIFIIIMNNVQFRLVNLNNITIIFMIGRGVFSNLSMGGA